MDELKTCAEKYFRAFSTANRMIKNKEKTFFCILDNFSLQGRVQW